MQYNNIKIAACVILYNPTEGDLKNIVSYISKVDKLYIYDNSVIMYDVLGGRFRGSVKMCPKEKWRL